MRSVRRGIRMSNVTSKRTCEASEKVKLSTLEVAGRTRPTSRDVNASIAAAPLSKSHVKVREKDQNLPGSSRVEPHQQIQHL